MVHNGLKPLSNAVPQTSSVHEPLPSGKAPLLSGAEPSLKWSGKTFTWSGNTFKEKCTTFKWLTKSYYSVEATALNGYLPV